MQALHYIWHQPSYAPSKALLRQNRHHYHCREEVATVIQKQLHAKSLSPQQASDPNQSQAIRELLRGLAGASHFCQDSYQLTVHVNKDACATT